MQLKTPPLSVLLIEDSPSDLLLIQKFLGGSPEIGRVESCTSLREGLQRLEADPVDVALLDLNLPDSSGLATFLAVHERAPSIPVVVLTASDSMALAHRAIEAGAQDFLTKGEIEARLLQRSLRYAVERHRNRRALAVSEATLRRIICMNTDAILVIDAQRCIRFANPAAEALFGYAADALQGQMLDFPLVIGQETRVEISHPEGDRVAAMRVAVTEHESQPAFLATLRDITQQVQTEAERLKAQQLELVGLLAGGIAHDFNNFLTTVNLNLHLMRRRLPPGDDSLWILGDMEKALRRARDLTQQLLTFSRGGAPILKTGSITSVVHESASFALSGSNVRCVYDLADDLWAVAADAGQISQVIHNLVLNADQAMPQGGHLHVRAVNRVLDENGDRPFPDPALPPGPYVRVELQDEGRGIHPDEIPRIFQPYFTTKSTGSGLGLATSYSIIKNHGGAITVESELDKGTVFRIYLPATPQPCGACETPTEGTREGRGRVLVMDDEDSIRRVLADVLVDLGYECTFARDGNEALERFVQERAEGRSFQAVVMDLTVPGGMGGVEAARRLHEVDAAVPMVACSAYADNDVARDPGGHGFRAFLRKPYTAVELSQALAEVCGVPVGGV